MHFSFRLGNEEQQPEVPILYHDVTSLLLIQILMMPQPLHKGMSLQFRFLDYIVYIMNILKITGINIIFTLMEMF